VSEPVVETQDLAVQFGGVHAVDHVNFILRERELRCLIGPNGAGKSTFFKSITGQIRAANSSGRVFIRGQDVTGWATRHIMRLGIGVKTQVPSVMNGLTVLENLWLSARRTAGHDGADAAVEEVVAELELNGIARRLVGELAHGQRQSARRARGRPHQCRDRPARRHHQEDQPDGDADRRRSRHAFRAHARFLDYRVPPGRHSRRGSRRQGPH
jgi:ABC-type uncharacterized transport system ATPase subunit